MGFVVDVVAMGLFFSEYFGFPLPLLFRQCTILIHPAVTGAI
jgi:hypothetical protein